MNEFHINQYLSVCLKREETMIYVAGQPFMQCKFLLLNIPITEVSTFDDIESIDEVAEKIDETTEKKFRKFDIPPDVEFWGHCSNLQVWYEHGYDTRLIHSNLAFPLLQKLTEVGDPLAKKVFKAEIINRYENGTERTRDYLAAEGFLQNFSSDERLNLLLVSENSIALTGLAEDLWPDMDRYAISLRLIGEDRAKVENRIVIELDLWDLELTKFPKIVLDLKDLKVLSLANNHIKEIPEEINKLRSLRELWLDGNEITHIPDSIFEITSLEKLGLGGNKIRTLPENIGDLLNLKVLRLGSTQIKELPESFYKLESLEDLSLSYNRLVSLPDLLCKLESLKWLSLSNNNLNELPECIKNLKSLEYLDVTGNPLVKNPETVEKLKKLKIKKIEGIGRKSRPFRIF